MALHHWAFLYTADGADPAHDRVETSTATCRSVFIGMESPEQGPAVARALVDEGVQLIEVCGGFGPVWTGRIIDAIDGAVPIGSVGYGPEAVDQVHAIFS